MQYAVCATSFFPLTIHDCISLPSDPLLHHTDSWLHLPTVGSFTSPHWFMTASPYRRILYFTTLIHDCISLPSDPLLHHTDSWLHLPTDGSLTSPHWFMTASPYRRILYFTTLIRDCISLPSDPLLHHTDSRLHLPTVGPLTSPHCGWLQIILSYSVVSVNFGCVAWHALCRSAIYRCRTIVRRRRFWQF